jgi:hypothetical protein
MLGQIRESGKISNGRLYVKRREQPVYTKNPCERVRENCYRIETQSAAGSALSDRRFTMVEIEKVL